MADPPLLETRSLYVDVNGTPIINGLDLKFEHGMVYAILGPNASGKSTLAKTIMGLPEYRVRNGDILMNGTSILRKNITERARMGIAYAFQNAPVIPGVQLEDFICRICPDYSCMRPDTPLMGESCVRLRDLYEDFNKTCAS